MHDADMYQVADLLVSLFYLLCNCGATWEQRLQVEQLVGRAVKFVFLFHAKFWYFWYWVHRTAQQNHLSMHRIQTCKTMESMVITPLLLAIRKKRNMFCEHPQHGATCSQIFDSSDRELLDGRQTLHACYHLNLNQACPYANRSKLSISQRDDPPAAFQIAIEVQRSAVQLQCTDMFHGGAVGLQHWLHLFINCMMHITLCRIIKLHTKNHH